MQLLGLTEAPAVFPLVFKKWDANVFRVPWIWSEWKCRLPRRLHCLKTLSINLHEWLHPDLAEYIKNLWRPKQSRSNIYIDVKMYFSWPTYYSTFLLRCAVYVTQPDNDSTHQIQPTANQPAEHISPSKPTLLSRCQKFSGLHPSVSICKLILQCSRSHRLQYYFLPVVMASVGI